MKKLAKVVALSGLFILAVWLSEKFLKNSFTQNVIFVGDSLLLGYKLEKEKSVMSLIEKSIPYSVVSQCNIGMTTNACRNNINKLLNGRAKYVVVELGANDFLLGRSAADTKKDFDFIIEFCKEKNSNVAIISFIDESMYKFCTSEKQQKLLADYADMYKKLAVDEEIELIDGIWQCKFGDYRYKVDYFHPNELGARVIANVIIETILTWE